MISINSSRESGTMQILCSETKKNAVATLPSAIVSNKALIDG